MSRSGAQAQISSHLRAWSRCDPDDVPATTNLLLWCAGRLVSATPCSHWSVRLRRPQGVQDPPAPPTNPPNPHGLGCEFMTSHRAYSRSICLDRSLAASWCSPSCAQNSSSGHDERLAVVAHHVQRLVLVRSGVAVSFSPQKHRLACENAEPRPFRIHPSPATAERVLASSQLHPSAVESSESGAESGPDWPMAAVRLGQCRPCPWIARHMAKFISCHPRTAVGMGFSHAAPGQ